LVRVDFRERLTAPVLWWLLGACFAVTMTVAVGFYLGPWWGFGVGTVCLAIAAAVLVSSSIVLRVGARDLQVGRARIEYRYVAGAHALDEARTRSRSSVQADARAFLVLRPYIATSVEITLDDPDDPVPYWLVSSRRPHAFAAAVNAVRSSKVTG
jgi:hypothetical protein